jgi:hemerythrin-like domain-containing protein
MQAVPVATPPAVPAPKTKARPTRSRAPALPALDQLDKTHREMLVTLDRLGELLEHLADNGIDDVAREDARAIHAYFDRHARAHHLAEETQVFPMLLAQRDAEMEQLLRRLQQDHGWLEEDWLELGPQLDAIARGYSWYDLDTLRAALPLFKALYVEHIALEESIVYPAARRRAAQG